MCLYFTIFSRNSTTVSCNFCAVSDCVFLPCRSGRAPFSLFSSRMNINFSQKGIDISLVSAIIIFALWNNGQQLAGLCKGSTTDSDSVCEGSNPSPAASSEKALRRWKSLRAFSCAGRTFSSLPNRIRFAGFRFGFGANINSIFNASVQTNIIRTYFQSVMGSDYFFFLVPIMQKIGERAKKPIAPCDWFRRFQRKALSRKKGNHHFCPCASGRWAL